MTRGRPSDYRPAYAEGASKLARLGATDVEIADFYDVDVRTIYRWKIAHDEFSHALKVGKEEADARVERALYHRAVGYEQQDVKIFMPAGKDDPVYAEYTAKIAPDVTAAIFWLKNRRPDEWRDKQIVDSTSSDGSMTPDRSFGAIEELTRRLNAIAERSAETGEPDAK